MSDMDPIARELEQQLSRLSAQALWLVDENPLPRCRPNPSVEVVGNRFDVIEQLQQQGWNARFNDFELETLPSACFNTILYRVSKEKAVVHHLIGAAKRLLKPNGELMLLGDKAEGIRTYVRKAETCLGGSRTESKLGGNSWCARIMRGGEGGECPDSQSYAELRSACSDQRLEYWAKPGLFGWNKIDRGSAFLIEQLPAMLETPLPLSGSVLDLGCGFGYLALNAAGPETRLVCTDNNAAALLACQYNLRRAGISGEVLASNAGDSIRQQFDTLLCNPPFHSGFSVDGDLTDRFLAAAQRLLTSQGSACFVVNQHIPLERKAVGRFADISLWADNGSFKLVRLRKPINSTVQGHS
ncbi:16S rRNA m(2)G 1207 methyltransferase [Marinobacterium iners DSM 11526]|uniref:16S rRNA m(2)G 1207 methyltransferase n=2 Tax=Marinobacterium iners TaxID=48076 RepID=A0A1H4GJN6_9GAMM|nr:16S rRNA m(2)G 1207 methyltransferase [Marinobacterium iners DSM 11526]